MKKIDKNKIKTWFVTGASSGVGHEMCKQLLDRGYNVIAVSRRVPDFKHENVLCLSCDVTDKNSVQAAVKSGIERFGKIDVLANNAGISANIFLEDETLEHMKKVMETNFFGTFNTMHELIPHFRENKNGTIINNTSQSGISKRARGSAYVSSKYAIEGLSGVCAIETQKFCRVMTLELGWFSGTEISKNTETIKNTHKEYKGLKAPHKNIKYKTFKNNLSKAIACTIEEVENEKIKPHLMLGLDSIIRFTGELKELQKSLKYSKRKALSCVIYNKPELTTLEKIFSVKNSYSNGKKRKIIRLAGLKFSVKVKG